LPASLRRQAFAKSGYAGAGVREIAQGAGVTAMLVNRYFGSKEQLFAEAVAESMATTSVVAPEIIKPGASGEADAKTLVKVLGPVFDLLLRSPLSRHRAP
jgi:AcrR family transcriptional regulator